jgi:hypothetical protein
MHKMHRILAALVFALPLAASAEEAVHTAFVGGLGIAQGLLGGHIQVRRGHLAAFAGTGLVFSVGLDGESYGGQTYGGVIGARFYTGDSGDRLFVSAQFAFNTQQDPGDPQEHFAPEWHHTNATTVTAGWRFRFESGLLLDLGAGGGFHIESPGYGARLIPDITMALGWEL